MNPMSLSDPWADSLDIISLQPVKHISRDAQWALVPLGPTLLILLSCGQ